jgi:cytochrome c-type biogenesis protein CcmH
MAMSPEFTLSKFDEVIVGARVSKSGSPMPQKGDLEGLSKPVKVGRGDVTITIDTELP